ncbi:MAG TPA: DUF4199 domain-containing protein [Cytophagales bacterium]|nr:DUF4199 domain-containing protein [Cytophagales bacterium]HAA24293.1 DUF4199 domain-containing protein [Cytophagales bacterium]HAP64347.1 DUF4199 domain-containing protein [Cytophagales bacterium]
MSYRSYLLIFGLIPGASILGLILLSMTDLFGDPESNMASGMAEIIGFATMILFLGVFLFVGISRYRNRELGGNITFKKAFTMGLLMVLIASVTYVAGWMAFGSQDFYDEYGAQQIATIEADATLSAEEQTSQIKEVEASMAMMENPVARAGMTFLEIFPVGLIIALIVGLLIPKSKPQSATA